MIYIKCTGINEKLKGKKQLTDDRQTNINQKSSIKPFEPTTKKITKKSLTHAK